MNYDGQRVVVVGGLGFIGAHLSRRLLTLGAHVRIVTRDAGRHKAIADEYRTLGASVVDGDLRNPAAMKSAVSGQDLLFNLAGQSGAVLSMEDPWTDLDVNCRGNLVLLEAIRELAVRPKVVFVSSRLAYGATDGEPVGEQRAPAPASIHAVHKVAVEQYLRIYANAYGVPFTVARLTNPYGPGQPRERTAYGVVNRMIHLAVGGQPLVVYGDGHQLRDYIYIDDAIDALVTLGSCDASGQFYNVGSGSGTRVADMARAIADTAGGSRVQFERWPALAQRIETGDFVADITKIRRETGWAPRVSLREGLARTIAFYRAQAA